ncbi:MAG: oxygenase MpaB family protein [Actinomycetota bacterium]
MSSAERHDTFHPDLHSRLVDLDRVEAVAFTPMDSRLRNQLITQTYGDIADAMAEHLGTDDITFCGIGQWASAAIADYLTVPIPFIRRMVAHPFGYGNRHIFIEVARAHVAFLETVARAPCDPSSVKTAWAVCEARLRRTEPYPPGTPATARDATTEDGLELDPTVRTDNARMIDGLRAYTDALLTEDAAERSQYILRGNLLIAAHEQFLLESSISLGFRTFVRQCTTAWRLLETKHEWHNHPPGRRRLAIESWWIRFATRRLVAVQMPWTNVRAGKPLPTKTHGLEIDSRLAADLDLGVAIDGRRATCWADWTDRMAFIASLVASEQRNPGWFDADGCVQRPALWSNLTDEVTARNDRIGSIAPVEPPEQGKSPLTPGDLEQLRMQPTNARAEALAHVRLSDVARNDGQPVDDDPARLAFMAIAGDVAEKLDAQTAPGGLLDPETVTAARAVFTKNEASNFMGLLFGALPDAYAAADGVKVLSSVSAFANDPFRRAGQTANFLIDLLTEPSDAPAGSFDAHGQAARSVIGVRGMHSIVSEKLLATGWNADVHGMPVNQEDTLGTMFTFVLGPFEMYDRLGLDQKPSVRDAYTRFWCGIAHLLGLPLELVTIDDGATRRALTYEEARDVMALIRHRNHRCSLDGVRLTEALLHGIGEGFPRWMDWVPLGMVLSVGDDTINRHLLIGEGRGRRRAAFVGAAMRAMFGNRLTRWPARWMLESVGDYWLVPFLEIGSSPPFRRGPTPSESSATNRAAVGAVNYDLWPTGC